VSGAVPPAAVAPGAVVFTDLVGFTEYTAVQGDADAVALLGLQESIVLRTLPSAARVVKELGDGLLLWFADATEALGTCLVLRGRFEATARETSLPLWVRIGMHWGRPARRGDDLVGHDVNLAARIVDLAGPGEVLCSGAVRDAAGDEVPGVEFVELGPVVVKGIPDPVALWRAELAGGRQTS